MSDSYIRRVLSHDAAWDTIFVRCRIVPLIEKHLNPYKNSRGNIRSNACRGVLSELCRVSIRLVDLRTSSNSFFLPNRSNVCDHRCSDWRLLVSNRRTTIRESNRGHLTVWNSSDDHRINCRWVYVRRSSSSFQIRQVS